MDNMSFDGEIKLENWNKKIKINEKGDYIVINAGDFSLVNKMSNLLEEISREFEELQNIAKDISDNRERVIKTQEFSESVAQKINVFFATDKNNPENICIKIFNTDCPFIDDIIDFLTQICSLIEKFTGKKVENLKKLSDKYKKAQNKRLGSRL